MILKVLVGEFGVRVNNQNEASDVDQSCDDEELLMDVHNRLARNFGFFCKIKEKSQELRKSRRSEHFRNEGGKEFLSFSSLDMDHFFFYPWSRHSSKYSK